MSKRVKTVLIVGGVILALGLAFLIFAAVNGIFSSPPESDSYDERIKVLNETFPTDIIVYGEDVVFRESLESRKVESLTTQNLSSTGYEYVFIVINDILGTVSISEQEYAMLLDLIKNEGYGFIYVGKSKLNAFKKTGFTSSLVSPINAGFLKMGEEEVIFCIWDCNIPEYIKHKELLGNSIVFSIVDKIVGRI